MRTVIIISLVFLIALFAVTELRAEQNVSSCNEEHENMQMFVDRMMVPNAEFMDIYAMQEVPKENVWRISIVDGVELLPEYREVVKTVLTYKGGLTLFFTGYEAFDFLVECLKVNAVNTI